MHEASIALAIVDELCERTATERVETVTAVHIQVGALTCVVPEALRFAWEAATDGTLACGSRLEIEHVPLAVFCEVCAREQRIEHSTLPVCPQCGTPSATIVRGRELMITAMEVVYAAAVDRRTAAYSTQKR